MSYWRPSAANLALQQRAALNRFIRDFFDQRGVLEVETPLLMQAQAAEPHLLNFRIGNYALQTSPESAMKRLLCAGSGPIYQLCKAFRADECGRRHNPEFTMLEWYQPQYSADELLQETLSLIQGVLGERPIQRQIYAEAFHAVTGLNPHSCSEADLQSYASQHIDGFFDQMDRSDWLDLIMSSVVEPTFDPEILTVVTEFPACQAALAKLIRSEENHLVAARFEVYCGGLELANGYDEACDPDYLKECLSGQDDKMLRAFAASNLRQCTGVALGVDRLLMLKGGYDHLSEVLSFDYPNA